MAQIDPADDSLWRWVVFHYRFVPERNQRTNALVAAFDNETEQVAAIGELTALIRQEVAAGTRDPKENVSGVTWHPGYHAEQGFGRLVESAIRHGVDVRPLLEDSETGLPSNMAVFGVDADGESWSFGGVPSPEPEEAFGGEPGNLTDKEPTEDSAAPTLEQSAESTSRKR